MWRLYIVWILLTVASCAAEDPEEDANFELGNEQSIQDVQDSDAVVAIEPEPNYEAIPFEEQEVSLAFTSCLDLQNKIPEAPSGVYKLFQPDENNDPVFFDGYCDMELENGGWTMVLNYVHLGGTNPPLQPMSETLPKFNLNNLGDDEQNTENFGHVSPDFLATWQFTEMRFYCRSGGHDRVLHFSTDSETCLDYMKTGVGNCDDVANNFTALTGHTATIPANQANGTNDAAGDAMLDRTFRDAVSDSNWDIRHGGNDDDWECDDDIDDSSNNTIHRVWFR